MERGDQLPHTQPGAVHLQDLLGAVRDPSLGKDHPSEKWELCTCNLCVPQGAVSQEKAEPVGDWPGDLTQSTQCSLRNPTPAFVPSHSPTAWQGGNSKTLQH